MKPQPIPQGISFFDDRHPDFYKRQGTQQLWRRWDPVLKIYRLYTYAELEAMGLAHTIC